MTGTMIYETLRKKEAILFTYMQSQDGLVFRVSHYKAIICQMNRSRFGG